MRPGYVILLVALFVFLVLDCVLGYAVVTGVFLSRLIDRDVAVEMFKAIVQVDGFLIGFGGVLATLVLAEVRTFAFSLSLPHRVWVLSSVFASAFLLLLSIMVSLAAMSDLHDNLPASSGDFFLPLSFLVFGVCFLCVVASGAVVRQP